MNKSYYRRKAGGLGLVEAMSAVVILLLLAAGALGYNYYASTHSRAAMASLAATRLGQLLLEDWKSTGCDGSYDPGSLGLGIVSPGTVDEGVSYFVDHDNTPIYISLAYNDVASDTIAGITLRSMHVTCSWRRDYTQGARSADDPTITLSSYVRLDASSG